MRPLTVLLMWMAAVALPAAAADIAVVVHTGVPASDITFAEVRKLALGDRQYWSSNLRVSLVIRAPAAREREVVLRTVYQMSEAQFRQYWIGKVFRSEAASGPTTVFSNEDATRMVASAPGSLSFVDSAQVPRGVKVLKVDGLSPGDTGYKLK